MLAGSKNQKIPTLKVNIIGSINEIQVIFLPKPSKKDQTDKAPVNRTKIPIAGNFNDPSKN